MTTLVSSASDTIDDSVDEEISACLQLNSPRSFFLYAGAGSGKTRSLVKALNRIRVEQRDRLRTRGQKVAVVTYTNAACEEIKRRLEFDPFVEVSTIHSFAWALLSPYQDDIREWVTSDVTARIADLEGQIARGKPGTKAAVARERSLRSKQRRLERLPKIRRFVYSPTGENRGLDALNHSEVLGMVSTFLSTKETLRRVLVGKYPIILIDESQDTNARVMDAMLTVQLAHPKEVSLGLFGDTMQRIYADGKVGLADAIPPDWSRPSKRMNHRCPRRVIALINRIRSAVDDRVQLGRSDKDAGCVRLFLLPAHHLDKFTAEKDIAARMAQASGDLEWAAKGRQYKTLTLEHHMAATRMGFDAMFEPLHSVDRLETGLLEGTLPALRFLTDQVLPLCRAAQASDSFTATNVLRRCSPLLDAKVLRQQADQMGRLTAASGAVKKLGQLWADGATPSFLDVLTCILECDLLVVPEQLRVVAEAARLVSSDDDQADDDELAAWFAMVKTPFDQIEAYHQYISGRAPFGTHQGVKGLEFPRVMVVVDDKSARGFMFSYEQLFGAKDAKGSSSRSQSAETSIDRTRRLFYVTCSRALESLAIVAYSESPAKVAAHVIAEGWFERTEVELIGV